jgi:hypothetical protein
MPAGGGKNKAAPFAARLSSHGKIVSDILNLFGE